MNAQNIIAQMTRQIEQSIKVVNELAEEHDIAICLELDRDTQPHWSDSDSSDLEDEWESSDQWNDSGC